MIEAETKILKRNMPKSNFIELWEVQNYIYTFLLDPDGKNQNYMQWHFCTTEIHFILSWAGLFQC